MCQRDGVRGLHAGQHLHLSVAGAVRRASLRCAGFALVFAACTRDREKVSPQTELERRLVRRLGAKGIRASVRCPDVPAPAVGQQAACTGVQVVDGVEHAFPIAVAFAAPESPATKLALEWSLPGRTVVDLRLVASDLMAQRRSLIPPACELDLVVLAPEESVPCFVLDDGIFRRLVITHHADRSHPFSWRWGR